MSETSERFDAIAWHCKDYADGWFSFDTEKEALEYQRDTGCLLRVVYRPKPATQKGEDDGRA